jgi:hypothetical protein
MLMSAFPTSNVSMTFFNLRRNKIKQLTMAASKGVASIKSI